MSGSTFQSEFPLTARQTLMWLDEQLYPESPQHNLTAVIELQGLLDAPRLSHAWAQTVASLDGLRMFVKEQVAYQYCTQAEAPQLPVISIGASELSPWVSEHSVQPLRRNDFYWDAALLRLAPDRHALYLCLPHILTDGVALQLLVEHLAQRYMGNCPSSSTPFRDYLLAEAKYRESPKAQEDRTYWGGKLASQFPPLHPYGISRVDRSMARARVWHEYAHERTERLMSLAGADAFNTISAPLSRFLVLATALGAFLYRVTGNQEILLGVPTANRVPRFAQTYGLLMEQMFLNLTVENNDTFLTLARRARTETLNSLRHGQACVSDRNLEYATLNMLPSPPTRFADLDANVNLCPASTVSRDEMGYGDIRDTFGLQAFDFGAGSLMLGFDLHRASFNNEMQQRVRSHFLAMLDAMAENPDTRLDSVDLLEASERRFLLQAGRGPEPISEPPDPVVQISRQAQRCGQRIAVESLDGAFTYQELDSISNQLAHRLRTVGVKRETRVAVAVPRGAGELISLIAVLKAGGVYIPVDLNHPVERIRVIFEDAAPEVLIAPAESIFGKVMPGGALHLHFDDLRTATDGLDCNPLEETYSSDQLAYILFTSGSTGRPKGVEVLRGAFANFLQSMARTPGLSDMDRLLAITTTTFDIAGLELFLPLWVGATVVIADRETSIDPKRLRRRLETESFTVMQATPATWRLLLDDGWAGDGRIRMFVGGEALSPELAAKLLQLGSELWNLYGPTETTVWSTVERVSSAVEPITIGRPIDNTTVYVLNGARNLVPLGVVGELYIGGSGLARGYRGRDDLTAERFVPDPFGGPYDRLYRTGDLGRLLDDGRFVCLGRVDRQVKIRGFRIELEEVEAVLGEVPGVKDVAVVARKQDSHDLRVIAYWIGDADKEALIQHARSKLPPYMVPSAYVGLKSFPLTTSRKVDRKALSILEPTEPEAAQLQLPRNDAETRVALVWSEITGISPIGIDQDFFDLGGNSVDVIAVRTRLEHDFGTRLPLQMFFETPTVEAMASKIGRSTDPDAPVIVTLRHGKPETPTLFCLLGIHLYRDLAEALEGECSVVGIHVPIRHFKGRQPPRVSEIAHRYVEKILTHQPAGPYRLAGLCFGGLVAFAAALQLEAMGHKVSLVCAFDAYLPGSYQDALIGKMFAQARGALLDLRAAIAILSSETQSAFGRVRATWGSRIASRPDGPELIDLDVVRGVSNTEISRFMKTVRLAEARLLVFRATAHEWPAWTHVDSGLGWTGLSKRMSVHEINCAHLEIVRPPHVVLVADSIKQALRVTSGDA